MVLFEPVLIQHLFGIGSLRQRIREVGVNVAYDVCKRLLLDSDMDMMMMYNTHKWSGKHDG